MELYEAHDGMTPLDAQEQEGLKSPAIATRDDLNTAEKANISKAESWAKRQLKKDILSSSFLCEVHRRMFTDVWTWAGEYRRSGKNIGVDAYRIPTELIARLNDTRYQLENSVYSVSEIAARLHHQLVYIHPFPDGNGRHARLIADLLMLQQKEKPFTWGQDGGETDLQARSENRKQYITALRAADEHNIDPLLKFVHS